jgi:pimeloyl-ACP methyl ester carboxylesterase
VRSPELIDAVVLYESGMAWTPGWDDTTMLAMLGSADAEEAGLRLLLGDQYDTAPEERRTRLRRQARAFIAEESSTRIAERPPYAMADVRVPVVYGTGDQAAAFAAIEAHLRDVADAQVVRLAGAGHVAHRTHPDQFADLVRLGLRRRAAEICAAS